MGSMGMVCNTLGIDRVNMDKKLILIEEQHGTNANFLVNAVLFQALKTKAICLILCHNTFSHYHNIGMRLGYNLMSLREEGKVTVVELMKIVATNIGGIRKDSVNEEKMIIPDVTSDMNRTEVHKLFAYVYEKYIDAMQFNGSCVCIFDDINHLLDFGFDVNDIVYFIRYLRSSIMSCPTSYICILTHTYRDDSQTSNADVLANTLKYMAHLCVTTQPFKTGHSSNASGKLIIHWRRSISSRYNWPDRTMHLFKLLDWQVRIGAPGTASILL